MNKYLLFVGETYYAVGGCKDLEGFYPTLEEAISRGKALTDCEKYVEMVSQDVRTVCAIDWFNVFDTEKMEEVYWEGEQLGFEGEDSCEDDKGKEVVAFDLEAYPFFGGIALGMQYSYPTSGGTCTIELDKEGVPCDVKNKTP